MTSLCKIKVSEWKLIDFWHDSWLGDSSLFASFHKIYCLDETKIGVVADHLSAGSSVDFLICHPYGDMEEDQWFRLVSLLQDVQLSTFF